MTFIFLFFNFFCFGSDFLEVEGFNQCVKLVNSHFKTIVYKSVGEENRVVCKLDLLDGIGDSDFELSFGFNSIANTLSQLFKRRWINE